MSIQFINLPLITDPLRTWTTGSGSSTGYSQNGNTGENERVYDTDPWGNTSVVWETRASGDGNADGGWNSDSISIDITKLYRFSVWVRRTSSTGSGYFYLGTAGGNQCPDALGTTSPQCNPYWHCGAPSALTQNQWYLVIGHIFPNTYSSTLGHPDTGFWTFDSTKKNYSKALNINQCNISGADLKWNSASTSTYHRTYHFYCGDNTTRLQFFLPRIDICDGNQPTLDALMYNKYPVLNTYSVTVEGASQRHQKVSATGGDAITNFGEWRIHRFNSSGTFTVSSYKTDGLYIEYLIVGGGGGGGMDMGGGGGGGGVLTGSTVLGPGTYSITVGAGGAGAPAAGTNGQPGGHQYTISATAGGDSSAFGFTAYGGGYGASSYYGYTPNYGYPGNGGCGGGPSGYSDGSTRSGGTGVSGQGYAGGGGGGQYYSGGGGGAGAVGTSSTAQPNGGDGKYSNILGRPYYWGGGGGGASYSLSVGGNGGKGGGGGGALGNTTGGQQAIEWGVPGTYGACCSWANVPGGNGGANTGGGGGGGSHYNANNKGGNGGSGIVIIRYKIK